MLNRIKEFFCKQKYTYEEGDILFKTTAPVAVVIIDNRTTLKGRAAYKVMSGLASKNQVVYQLELSSPQFTHGCIVNLFGFEHKFRVMYPVVKPDTDQVGYRLEMLTKRGTPFAKPRESFHIDKAFKNIALYNIYNSKIGKWRPKK